ncbi:hypothetical protein BUALT_Bualt16G0007500 [Buddleja alternifolia]|uniref:Dof-type domain-containing protein n=1 Tax=Buddleja alternifolia TaxID=168488 RepID=A0AAV6WIM4_9LAMI|nr:hypothetical protein BUALT_Bualt16G0007500 [Buddleja alternifolia]
MFEVKDIKLFGKTIELPETSATAEETAAAAVDINDDSSNQDPPCSSDSMIENSNNLNNEAEEQESHKSLSSPREDDRKQEDKPEPLTSEDLKDSNMTPPIVEDSKTEEDQSDTSNSQEKTLKKPDKIVPCPRCNSMDTKFCYFNNYNVNQPRHFCKNCQRYWTAGGTMRNVPVGAGRRKNKNSARHLTIPEAAQVDLVNGIHHPNGTVLTFSSDAPLCDSMVSGLNIADKTIRNGSRNGSVLCKENGDDHSSGSSVSSKDEVGKNGFPEMIPNCHPFPQQVPFFPGAPWPYPWNFGPAGFPLPFYSTAPPPYWACASPGSWNVPWVIPQTSPTSGPNSPTLGKHPRDENVLKPGNEDKETRKESNPEKCLWVPKTLRIDDPGEAAKSSIWATLGIKHDRVDSIGGGGLFKAFQSQSKDDKKVPETSTVLQANPAALSRSLNFHESS